MLNFSVTQFTNRLNSLLVSSFDHCHDNYDLKNNILHMIKTSLSNKLSTFFFCTVFITKLDMYVHVPNSACSGLIYNTACPTQMLSLR